MVVLHGGPGAPGEMAPLARDLSAGFTVLEPLQRRSGGPPLTVARHVEDLAAVLPEGAALVGWSWGAMLALSFCARHPGRAGALALVGCGTYDVASRASLEEARAHRLREEGRQQLGAVREKIEAAGSDDERDRLLEVLGRLVGESDACDPLPGGGAGTLAVDWRGHRETWGDVLRLQAEGVEPAAFATIRCPVLMLHGAEDPHPGPATFDLLRRFMPQLRYRSFERCGHKPWAERWAREPFLATLREWLAGPEGRASRHRRT